MTYTFIRPFPPFGDFPPPEEPRLPDPIPEVDREEISFPVIVPDGDVEGFLRDHEKKKKKVPTLH